MMGGRSSSSARWGGWRGRVEGGGGGGAGVGFGKALPAARPFNHCPLPLHILLLQYHNFRKFRIYDLSDHRITHEALVVRQGGGVSGGGAALCVLEVADRQRGVGNGAARRPHRSTPPPHAQSHPMALQRLAAFFQDQHFQQSGNRKPIVLIGPRRAAPGGSQRCLVVGFEATNRMHVRTLCVCVWGGGLVTRLGHGCGGGEVPETCGRVCIPTTPPTHPPFERRATTWGMRLPPPPRVATPRPGTTCLTLRVRGHSHVPCHARADAPPRTHCLPD